jgi:phospholipid/cholesterol/gamma-HCH transport system ATP-binding protein
MAQTPILSVEQLGFCYLGQKLSWVFQNISFELNEGEQLVLIGPSGIGKSTLLKCIAGLLQSTHGKVTCYAKNMSMLFQKNALFDSLTAIENLVFALNEAQSISRASAKSKAQQILSLVGLEGTEDKFPHELSGGMQKRLGIARAWITDPDFLIYDEPTAGLDPITSKQISDLLLKKTTSALIVTNDLFRAVQLGTRVLYMESKQMIDLGAGSELARSKDPRALSFISGRTIA